MDLGEQKVTLALLRETRYLICLHVQRKITALILNFLPNSHSGLGSSPFYYDDWLSLDLKNVSEEILWLHSVEVCIQLPMYHEGKYVRNLSDSRKHFKRRCPLVL